MASAVCEARHPTGSRLDAGHVGGSESEPAESPCDCHAATGCTGGTVDPHSVADTFSDTNQFAHANCYPDRNINGNPHGNANQYAFADRYTAPNRNANANRNPYGDVTACGNGSGNTPG